MPADSWRLVGELLDLTDGYTKFVVGDIDLVARWSAQPCSGVVTIPGDDGGNVISPDNSGWAPAILQRGDELVLVAKEHNRTRPKVEFRNKKHLEWAMNLDFVKTDSHRVPVRSGLLAFAAARPGVVAEHRAAIKKPPARPKQLDDKLLVVKATADSYEIATLAPQKNMVGTWHRWLVTPR